MVKNSLSPLKGTTMSNASTRAVFELFSFNAVVVTMVYDNYDSCIGQIDVIVDSNNGRRSYVGTYEFSSPSTRNAAVKSAMVCASTSL